MNNVTRKRNRYFYAQTFLFGLLLSLVFSSSIQAQDLYLESECGTVGLNWQTQADANASNGEYSVYIGSNSLGSAPGGVANHISFDAQLTNGGTYYLFLRTLSPTSGNNSVWVRVNGGTWHASALAVGSSYVWNQMNTGNNTGNTISVTLSAGSNTIDIAYRESGCQIDKLYLSQTATPPSGSGGSAGNCEGGSGGGNGGNNPPPPTGQKMLFVVGNPSLNTGDQLIKDWLETDLGFEVTVANDDGISESASSGMDLILISSTVHSSKVNTTFTHTPIPVGTWEPALLDDLAMADINGTYNNDFGLSSGSSIEFMDPNDPMSAGNLGNVQFFSSPTDKVWGIPNANAVIIARKPGQAEVYYFRYEAGAQMYGGIIAPAMRFTLPLFDNAATNLAAGSWEILKTGLQYIVPPPVVSSPVLNAPVSILLEANSNQNFTGITLDDGSSIVIGTSNATDRIHYQYQHNIAGSNGYFTIDTIKGAPQDTVICRALNVPGISPNYAFVDCQTLDLSQYNISSTTSTVIGDYDMIASRVKADGTVMWSRTFGTQGFDWFSSNLGTNLTQTSDGHVMMTMSHSQLYTQPLRSMLIKVDVGTGEVIWSKYSPMHMGDDRIKSLYKTTDDYLLTTGPSFTGPWGCHLQKLTESGGFVLGKKYGETGETSLKTRGHQVIEGGDGTYLLDAYHFDLSTGKFGAALINVSSDGASVNWSKWLRPANASLLGTCNVFFNDIQVHPQGGYVAIGFNECDVTNKEMLVARLNADGTFAWIQSYGTSGEQIDGSRIEVMSNGDLAITGYTSSENFVAKLSQSNGAIDWFHGFAPTGEGAPLNIEVLDGDQITVIGRTISSGAIVSQFGADGMPAQAYACGINDLKSQILISDVQLILENLPITIYNFTTPYQYEPIQMFETIEGKGVSYKEVCPGFISNCANDPLVLGAPSPGFNAITTYTLRTEVQDANQIGNLPFARDVHQGIAYFDGLGRSLQSVSVGASPDHSDIVDFTNYDSFGRVPRQYLPFNDANNPGSYRADVSDLTPDDLQETFYQLLYPHMGGPQSSKNFPFGETAFESSPRNIAIEKGAPGSPSQLGANTLKLSYQTNEAGEIFNFGFVPTFSLTPSFYPPNTLIKRGYEDENGKMTYEYQDKLGRLICKMSEVDGSNVLGKTYFVYDQFENIRYVLPPEAVKEIESGSTANVQDFLDRQCYQYVYDVRQLVVEKKIPGSGWAHIVYNLLGDPVMTQSSNQRLTSSSKPFPEWTILKYDSHERQIIEALWEASASGLQTREELQAHINNLNEPLYESRANTSFIVNNQSYTLGYTDNVFPAILSSEILSVTFYDDYNFDFGSDGVEDEIFDPAASLGTPNYRTRGMSTGEITRILNPEAGMPDFLSTVVFVDEYGQSIQSQKQNHLGGIDIQDVEVNFAGEVLTTILNHTTIGTNQGGNTEIQLVDQFCYDHQGRLLRKTQEINEEGEIVLFEQSYNELGQLAEKNLGPQDGLALQSLDYKYNIQGELTDLNELGSPGDCGNGENDMFRFRLHYEDPLSDINPGSTPRYNGEISSIQWQAGDDCMIKGQAFAYDDLNRLTNSWYAELDQSEIWVGPGLGRSTSYSYNLNGDIQSLSREGLAGNTGLLDDLTFAYETGNSNRLLHVTDAGDPTGFADGNTSGNDYSYDSNGNLTSDLNKEITQIEYNILDKPEQITFGNGNTISYVYAADGEKLRQTVNGSGIQQRDYLVSFQYVDLDLEQIARSEGRKISDGNGGFQDEYYLKDHLGNVRAMISDLDGDQIIDPNVGELVETNDYYPFGMRMDDPTQSQASPPNRHKYNGKELHLELGLHWYDYGARMYDPAIGRWGGVDAYAELMQNYSPYTYTYNNPVNFIDPDGNKPCGKDKDGNIIPGPDCDGVAEPIVITAYGTGNTISGYQARADALNALFLWEFGRERPTGSGSATVTYKDVDKVNEEFKNAPYIGPIYDVTVGGYVDVIVGFGETFNENKASGLIKIASGLPVPGFNGFELINLGNRLKKLKKWGRTIDNAREETLALLKRYADETRNLVRNNKVDKALLAIENLAAEIGDEYYQDKAIMLYSNLKEITEERLIGKLDYKDYSTHKNRIKKAALDMLREIEGDFY